MKGDKMFNINDFYAQLSFRGTIKTSKFKVFFSLPPCFTGDPEQGLFTSLVRDMELRIDKASIPGITHQMTSVRRYGYGAVDKISLVPNFDDIQISIIADANGDLWRFYQKWLNKTINADISTGNIFDTTELNRGNPTAPYEVSYKDDFAVPIAISWYSDDGNEAQQIVLNEAFPSAVSEVKMDWGDQGEVARFMVNLSYNDYYLQKVT
jgi:hypothetical protein